MNRKIIDLLEECPVISAIKSGGLEAAANSQCSLVFLLAANILSVKEETDKLHTAGKKVFVHIDLAEGIGKDGFGVSYLKKCGADGIISTKSAVIRMAKEQNLVTVQRIFALDSQGILSAAETVKTANPDFIEIMPGIAYKAIKQLSGIKIPVIAGGLISEKSEIFSALDSGAIAVSTGKQELWDN